VDALHMLVIEQKTTVVIPVKGMSIMLTFVQANHFSGW
jgi:hypothetical protein